MPTIRLATEDDARQVRAIYAPYCSPESPVSFEVEPPTVAEMARRIDSTLEHHPWLVCDDAGEVAGFVYAGPHSGRAAYRWSVNVSAYVAEGRRGSGIGRGLYASLFEVLKLQGFVNAYAGATLPNPASVGLHQAVGFEEVGIYRGVGFKAGAWRDTIWWQRPLGDRPPQPVPPLTLAEARCLAGWRPAIEAGLALIRRARDAP